MAETYKSKKYLSVRYADRELAKRLGARWDPAVQKWYCPDGAALATIFKWRGEAAKITAAPHPAQNENFELALQGAASR